MQLHMDAIIAKAATKAAKRYGKFLYATGLDNRTQT